MVKLAGPFSRLGPGRILVIGDFLLDAYTFGKARRISPEAPVPVVQVQNEEQRPGGAGNVVLNLISMGCQVTAVGRIGNDPWGAILMESLESEGVDVNGLFFQQGYPTPVKNRIIAENQQIVRIDNEQIVPIPELLEQQVIEKLPFLLKEVKVIAISDYGKGFLSRTLLSAVIELGRRHHIPIIADPKGIDFTKYAGSTIIKPNLSEAYAAAGLPMEAPLDQAARKVLQLSQSEILMVTRSEAGITLFDLQGLRQDFPVKIREVKDVTGAGDTVLAMFSCALANGLSIVEAAQLSNVAAGIAIERLGCARVTLAELARRLLEFDMANKVFDHEHLFALQKALCGRKLIVLGVSASQGLTSQIFKAIRQLSQHNDFDLLLYIKEQEPDAEFVNLLSSLHEIDFILVNGESLRQLCSEIVPEEVYEVKGSSLQKLTNAEAFFTLSHDINTTKSAKL